MLNHPDLQWKLAQERMLKARQEALQDHILESELPRREPWLSRFEFIARHCQGRSPWLVAPGGAASALLADGPRRRTG
jgi:hypothetical protein